MQKPLLVLTAVASISFAQTDSIDSSSIPFDSTSITGRITKAEVLEIIKGNNPNSVIVSDTSFDDTTPKSNCSFKDENGWYRFWGYMYDRFELMPELHMQADMSGFTFQKNADFNQRYLLESNTYLEIAIARFKKNLYFNWDIEFCTGMGRNQGKNVLFAPAEINYGIVPKFEYRFTNVNVQAGLNHHCFHEIDKKEEKTVYCNRLYVAARSKNQNMMDYWSAVRQDSGWNWKNRWSWYGEAGTYIKDVGDAVPASAINGENDRELEFHADFRMSPFKTRYWLYNITSQTLLGSWRNDTLTGGDAELFWQENLGAEMALRKGTKGAMIFSNFYLDKMPTIGSRERFSKDRLVEFGFRFFI